LDDVWGNWAVNFAGGSMLMWEVGYRADMGEGSAGCVSQDTGALETLFLAQVKCGLQILG